MTDLRTAAQQVLEALEKYRRHLNLHGKSDVERALEAALAEPDVPCSTCVSLARAVMMDQMGRA